MTAKKKALGKGLGALLDNSPYENPNQIDKDIFPVGTIANIVVEAIEENPYQPRKEFDEKALQELAASIKEQGLIQPITVRKTDNNKFQLISGERRFKASLLAGLTSLPAYIRNADDQAMLEMAIVENIQREDLNPIEIAMGYQQLIDECKLTQEVLSERLGKGRSSITNYLRLLKLPSDIQMGINKQQITMGHAKALLGIDEVQTQIDVFHDIVAQNLSVREVEEIAQNLSKIEEESETTEEKKTNKKKADPEKYKSIQENLATIYGTKVQVKAKTGGKGSIVIPFKSEDELERILKVIDNK